jgi:hypothetical protein
VVVDGTITVWVSEKRWYPTYIKRPRLRPF